MLKNEKNPTHCARGKDSQNGIIAEEKPEGSTWQTRSSKNADSGVVSNCARQESRSPSQKVRRTNEN